MPLRKTLFSKVGASIGISKNDGDNHIFDNGTVEDLKTKYGLKITDDDVYNHWASKANLESIPIEEFDTTIPFYAQGARNDLPEKEKAEYPDHINFVFPNLYKTPLYEYLTALYKENPALFRDNKTSSTPWTHMVGGKDYTDRLFNTWENQKAQENGEPPPHTPNKFRDLYWIINKDGFNPSFPIVVNRYGVIYNGKHRGVLATFFRNHPHLYEKNNPISVLRILEGNGGLETDFEKYEKWLSKPVIGNLFVTPFSNIRAQYWWNRTPIPENAMTDKPYRRMLGNVSGQHPNPNERNGFSFWNFVRKYFQR